MAAVRGWLLALCVVPTALLVEGSARADGTRPVRHLDRRGRMVEDVCPYVPGQKHCYLHRILDPGATPGAMPLIADGGPPTALGGNDMASLYNMPASASGHYATVAAVDAYGDSPVLGDVNTYRAAYGLGPIVRCPGTLPPVGTGVPGVDGGPMTPCLAVVNQNGSGNNLPGDDAHWAGESSLDVEMISAGCPDCNIVLVQANTPSQDLDIAVQFAGTIPGIVAVSNSYGSPESAGSASEDPYYHLPCNTPQTCVLDLASTGDADYNNEGMMGASPGYPASSPYVLGVGGTIVSATTPLSIPAFDGGLGRPWQESVWNLFPSTGSQVGTTSGCSQVFRSPATRRASPDRARCAQSPTYRPPPTTPCPSSRGEASEGSPSTAPSRAAG
jgi:subtilase family serine protease